MTIRHVWITLLSATVLAIAACSTTPTPTAPTVPAADAPRAAQALSSGTAAVAISQPATSSLFGSSSADLASCLHASADSACFSGARISARAVEAAATAPGVPLNFSATASGGTVTLTWAAPVSGDPVATYVIEAGSRSGEADLANIATGSTATTFSASGVGSGTYYVRVRAQNASGVSAASNESALVVGTSACTSAPNAPGGLLTSASGTTVTLAWTAPAGGCAPTAYILEAGSAVSLSDLANSTTGATATSYVALGVAAGTYYVRIRAVNAYGQSAASNESTLVVGTPGSPPSVTTSAASGLSTTAATLNGSVNPNGLATTASFQWGLTTGYGTTTATHTSTGTSAVNVASALSGLASGTVYHYRLVATNSAGTANGSDVTFIAAPVATATARYRAVFDATWSGTTHPVEFPTVPPAVAHFSPLVGGTHNAQVVFWREAALATDGIKDMAERGLTTTLLAEVQSAIATGTAERAFTGGSVPLSPGSATAEFEASQTFPLVTLVTMVAPSPDWFAGVSALPLFRNGQWIDEQRIELVPWDAGTDSGVTFTSPDLVTVPRLPVARIVTAPLSPSGRVTPIGTFTFTRLP